MKTQSISFKFLALTLLSLLSLNVWGAIADGSYVLCTSTSDLVAGEHYIIANGTSGGVNCISNVSNSNNRKIVDATVSDSKINVPAASTIMTFTLGGTTDAWTFQTDNYAGTNGYLASAASGSNNYCRVIADETTATINFSDNAAVVTLQPHTSRNILRYNPNNGNPLFACYSSGQSPIYLYKKSTAAATPYTVTFDAGANGTCSTSSLTEASAGAGVTLPSVTANTGYRFVGWSTSTTPSSADAGAAGATYKPSADCTLYAYYVQTHTVKWFVNNSIVKSESQGEGVKLNTLTMPDTPADDELPCSDKFMGWSRTNLGAPLGQNAPDDLFTDISKLADSEVVGSTDITFYAVFASSGGAAGTSKIWDVDDIVSGGAYYIGGTVSSKDYFLKQRPSSVAEEAYKNGSTNEKGEAEVLTFTKSGSNWTIKVGNKYVALNSTNASLTYQTSSATFEISGDDGLYLENNNRQFTLNASSLNNFGSYATTFTGGADIWLLPTTGYEDYVTACGKSLSISPNSLTAESPNSGTGTLMATANLYTPTGYTWTSDNEAVATVSGTGATATVTYHASGTCTITCSAPDGSNPMTATATVTVPAGSLTTYTDIPSLYAAATTTAQEVQITFNNWIVSGIRSEENVNQKVFVTDGENGFMIMGSDYSDLGFQIGDILSGTVTCRIQRYENGNTFNVLGISSSDLTVTHNGTIEPVTISSLSSLDGVNSCSVIKLDGWTYDSSTQSLTKGSESIKVFDWLKSGVSLTNGHTYNVTGAFFMYRENAESSYEKEIMFRTDGDFEDKTTTYTVSWKLAGADYTTGSPSTSAYQGDHVETLPTPPANDALGTCANKFVGWSATDLGSTLGQSAPSDLFSTPSASPAVTANVTYHAVFATEEEGGGSANLTKLGSGTTFSDGDKIVIVANVDDGKLMYQETVSTSYVAYKQIGSGDGQVELTAAGIAADDKNWFTLTAGTGENAGKWRLGDATNGYINVSSNNLYCDGNATYFTIAWNSAQSGFTIKDGDRWIGCRADLEPGGGNQYKWRGAGAQASPTANSVCYLDIYRYSASDATYSDYVTKCCIPLAAPTGLNSTPNTTGGAISWDAVANASGYEVKIDDGNWTTVSSTTYTITDKECGGVEVTWQIRAVGTDNYCSEGTACEAQHFNTTACACTQYSFHYGTDGQSDWDQVCFSGDGDYRTIENFTIPNKSDFYVGWAGTWQDSYSQVVAMSTLKLTRSLQKNEDQGVAIGTATGAQGTLRVTNSWGCCNKRIAFDPAGYGLCYGPEGGNWSSLAMSSSDGVTYMSEQISLTSDMLTNSNYKYYVGVLAPGESLGYKYAGKSNTSVFNTMGIFYNSTWVQDGQIGNKYVEGVKGRIRMWSDDFSDNWHCHFVPDYNYILKDDDENILYTSSYVSCEASDKSTTIDNNHNPSKDGYALVGWSREKGASSRTLDLGANYNYWKPDDVFYPVWQEIVYTLDHIEVKTNPTKTTYAQGETLDPTGLVLTATYTDNIDGPGKTEEVTSGFTYNPMTLNTVGENTITVTYQGETATFNVTVLTNYTVKILNNGEPVVNADGFDADGNKTYPEGSALGTLPALTESDACDLNSKTFVGWMVGTINGKQSSAPDMVSASTTVNSDLTLNAVWAEGDGSPVIWTRMEASDINESGTYALITLDGNAFTGKISSGRGEYTSDAFLFTNNISTIAPAGTLELNLIAYEDDNDYLFDIYNADYGYLYVKAAREGNLGWTTNSPGDDDFWIYYSDDTETNFEYWHNAEVDYYYASLRVNAGSFRTYASNNTNGTTIAFAKKSGGTSLTNYATTCATSGRIFYNANGATGGTAPIDNTEYTYGSTATVLGNPALLAKTHYTFAGWNTAADGTGTHYDANDEITINGDITLYAEWTPDVHTVTWSVNGDASEPVNVNYGERVTSLPSEPDIICGDKVFVGWTTSTIEEETDEAPAVLFTDVASSPTIEGNTTFYAVFANGEEGDSPVTKDIISELGITTSVTLNGDNNSYQIGELPITLTGTKGTNNFPAINYNNTSGTDLRFYKGTTCAVTFATTNGKPITNIEFKKNASTSSTLTGISANVGTLSDNVWTGNATNVTFTYNNSETNLTGQIYIINVTYVETGGNSYTNYSTSCSTLYDLTWHSASGAPQVTQVTGEETIVPVTPTECANKTFMGWVDDPITELQQDAPSFIDFSTYTVSSDKDFYAVYVSKNGGKVTGNDLKVTDNISSLTYDSSDKLCEFANATYSLNEYASPACVTVSSVGYCGFKLDASMPEAYVTTTNKIKDLKAVSFDYITNSSAISYGVYISNDNTNWTKITSDGVTLSSNTTSTHNILVNTPSVGDYYVKIGVVYKASSKYAVITAISYTTAQMGYWYSDYSTSCDMAPSTTMTFDANGATGSVDAISTPGWVTLPDGTALTKDCDIFAGWQVTGVTDYTQTFQAGDQYLLNHDVTMTAQWTAHPCATGSLDASASYITTTNGVAKKSVLYTLTITNMDGETIIPVISGTDAALFAVTDEVLDLESETKTYTFRVQYTPTAASTTNTEATLTFTDEAGQPVTDGSGNTLTMTLNGRSVADQIVLAAKVGNTWYALPSDMASADTYIGLPITVDDADNPTTATVVPTNAVYTLRLGSSESDASRVRFASTLTNNNALWGTGSNDQITIRNYAQIENASGDRYDWILTTSDLNSYTLTNNRGGSPRNLSLNTDCKWGLHGTLVASSDIRILAKGTEVTFIPVDVIDWKLNTTGDAFLFTTTVTIPSHDNVKIQYTGDPVSASISGTGVYTITSADMNLTSHSLQPMTIQWYNGDNMVAVGSVNVPVFVTTSDGSLTTYDSELLKTADVYVLNGGKLTVAANCTIRNLIVEGGGVVDVTEKTFSINQLALHGGLNEVNGSQYAMPRLYVASGAVLKKSSTTVNLDLTVDKRNYYPFAVPFAVKVSDIDYVDPVLKNASVYNKHFVIKTYDGANRAANGEDKDANWTVVESSATLQPGVGYIITAVAPAGYDSRIRIPMNIVNGWTADGELYSYNDVTRNEIAVTAHTGAAAVAQQRHAGWNFVSNPYLTAFAGSDISTSEGLEVAYASIPTYNFSEYIQTPLSEAVLSPEWGFFVQVATAGIMTFAATGRQAMAPRYLMAENGTPAPRKLQTALVLTDNTDKSDRTGLIICDRYSAAYEIGADLEKMFGSGYTLATYTIVNGTRLAYNAMSETEAHQLIPVGYRAPEAGSYTFSLDVTDDMAAYFDRLDLIDYETGELTNLLTNSYTFITERTQSDSRFAINATVRKVPTKLDDGIPNMGDGVQKVIYDEHLYIIDHNKVYDGTGSLIIINK